MTQLYVVNKLETPLDLKSGYLIVPALGYAPLLEQDKNDQTVLYALGRQWIEITDSKPTAETAIVPEGVEIEITQPYEGMSEEELKTELAKEKTGEATTTDIGVDTPVIPEGLIPEGEPVAEATETATKPGRKKAAN